jgi:hypothetical protein
LLGAQNDVEFVRAEVFGECRQYGVDLAGWGEGADGLIAVEVGGKCVALRGGDHCVVEVARRASCRLHRQ